MKDFYISTEKKREWNKQYYEKNKDKIKEYSREYRAKNAEKISTYQKRYAMTHDRTEYYREYNKRRKQKKATADAEE